MRHLGKLAVCRKATFSLCLSYSVCNLFGFLKMQNLLILLKKNYVFFKDYALFYGKQWLTLSIYLTKGSYLDKSTHPPNEES